MRIAGIETFLAGLRGAHERARVGAKRGLGLALQNVLDVSNRTVPVEEGDLRRDGGWSLEDGRKLRGAVSYGRRGDTRDYAVPQHERMDYKHDAGRGPKFLENALNSQRETSAKLMGREIKGEMGS
jgi:hypothetical protein